MTLRKLATLVLCLTLLSVVQTKPGASAQERRREVTWVNRDIPKVQGLIHKVLDSQTLGHEIGYVVWTPPEFDDSGRSRYPVVYFLHGAGGSEKSDSGGFSARLAAAIGSRKFPPSICVFPNGGMSGYRGDVEAMLVQELIPLIDKSYPTRAEGASRVVCGFSMGGAGAVHLAIQHPGLFKAAGSWGGSLSWRGNGEDSPLLPIASGNANTLKDEGFALLTVNGDQDRPDGFKPLTNILVPAGVSCRTVVLADTDHNLGKYYERSEDAMIEFLAEHLKGTRPVVK